jgi:PAS domain S-box-containing protein
MVELKKKINDRETFKVASPVRLLLILASTLFAAEALIMAMLRKLRLFSPLAELVMDPLLLVLFLFPILYGFIVRPYRKYMVERMKMNLELGKIHVTLEQRVTERTRELDSARVAALNLVQDVEEARKYAEDVQKVVEARSRQHVILATLGQFALTASSLQTLMDEIVVAVTRAIGVEYCQILELLPDGTKLVMRSGFGWKEGSVGQVTVESETTHSLAGYTLSSRWAILVGDLKREERFSVPRHLLDHEIESGMSVTIEGAGDKAYGVLGAFTKVRRTFSQEDAHFLEAVANILSSCIRRKRSEETLKQSEEQSRLIIETARDAFIGMDAEGLITAWNRHAEVLFGWSRLEAVGRRLADTIIPERYREAHVKGLKRFIETGEAPVLNKQIEISALRRDGREFPVELTIWPVQTGKIIRFNAFIHDITERKQARERLDKINDCFLNFGPDPNENINALTKLAGELMQAACALYNRMDGGLLCSVGQWQTPADFSPVHKPEGRICYDMIQQSDDKLFVVRNLQKTSYAETDPNVKSFHLETYIGKLVKTGGVSVGTLCTVYQKDVVPGQSEEEIMGIIASAIGIEEERRRSLEELKNMQTQLVQSEKVALANQLAAGVAHEVKNPLAILLQGIEYLTENVKGNGKAAASILEDMGTAVRRADSIIKGLLDLAAPARLALEPEDVNAAVESALLLVKGVLERNRIRVIRHLNVRIPKVAIDRGKLIQALINLFSNSASFMPEGGELGIKTYVKKVKSGSEDAVAVEVEDTGPGIPEEHLAKVFEPFFTTRRAKGGTGLGLSVVKNIVELHQGTIEIKNKPAGGAVVTMTFPVLRTATHKG